MKDDVREEFQGLFKKYPGLALVVLKTIIGNLNKWEEENAGLVDNLSLLCDS